eukprot:scaffold796_cov161-Prasinococcus_capsulatus_cf.AAC.2
MAVGCVVVVTGAMGWSCSCCGGHSPSAIGRRARSLCLSRMSRIKLARMIATMRAAFARVRRPKTSLDCDDGSSALV